MKRTHDSFAANVYVHLLNEGHRIATEVGIPGGRVDLVRLSKTGRWLELYEVKINNAAAGVEQLLRYAEIVGGALRLTLVVPPELMTERLELLGGERVRVWACEPNLQLSLWFRPGVCHRLPYIHPDSAERIRQAHYRRARERWASEVAA